MIMSRNDWFYHVVTQVVFFATSARGSQVLIVINKMLCTTVLISETLNVKKMFNMPRINNENRVHAQSIIKFGLSYWDIERVMEFFVYHNKQIMPNIFTHSIHVITSRTFGKVPEIAYLSQSNVHCPGNRKKIKWKFVIMPSFVIIIIPACISPHLTEHKQLVRLSSVTALAISNNC